MNQAKHVDVVIVGAGLSGIGAAYHLTEKCPDRSYLILEGRDAIGGTWDLFRYPGIRSDSDMHTLGYNFKPWREAKSIADGPSIRKYVNETATEHKIKDHIHFNHWVSDASWSSDDACWTVMTTTGESAQPVQFTCNFLFMCGGYYDYEEGYTPEFPGANDYQGRVVHPQHWPEDLNYQGKKVVVIGSGATAMTLVPAMAKEGANVTMVQRSPTYVVSRPDKDKIANTLRKYLPEKWAYAITRFKNTKLQDFMYKRTRTQPAKVKKQILDMVRQGLEPEIDVDKHFTPSYNPWDQRLCLIPNADLFHALKSGVASVVTGTIDTFTPTGLKMTSGEELDADIIVTATGLNMVVMSKVKLVVDGEPVHFPDKVAYKGMMFNDVPNLVQTFGYINASWTLRADLTSEYVCRLLNHMRDKGVRQCTPRLRAEDANMQLGPWIADFSAGYMARIMPQLPKQGDKDPWRNTQNYALEKKLIRKAELEDGAIIFDNPGVAAAPAAPAAIAETPEQTQTAA